MTDVGGREADGLKKPGHEIKTVSRGVKELLVLGNLIRGISVLGNVLNKAKANLL